MIISRVNPMLPVVTVLRRASLHIESGFKYGFVVECLT